MVKWYDAPTMNEYITHSVNGFLFSDVDIQQEKKTFFQRVKNKLQNWTTGQEQMVSPYQVSVSQDWGELGKMDLEKLGCVARSEQESGYSLWEEKKQEYADFILNW